MSSWLPEWKVEIDNLGDLKDITLSNVTITSGRTNIYTQPQASYASLDLLNLNEEALEIDINDSLTISLKDSTGTYIPIFGGFITDINQSIRRSGHYGTEQVFSLIALGALARLPKIITDGTLSKDQDGDQIYTILSGFLYNKWNQVPAATKWNTYDATTTWANAENTGLGEIDRPGDYDLDARSASNIDVYSLVSDLATSGLGYLYEDAQGRICYADSTHRSQYLATNGYTTISADLANAAGIRSTMRSGDLRNKVVLKYKANQSSEITDSDSTSISLYGEQGQIISTTLDKTADATSQAAFYLALRSYPRPQLDSITFQLNNPNMTSTTRNNLIGIFMGWPLKLTGLPANMMNGQFEGFVEGWTFRTGLNSLNLTIQLSPLAYSIQSMRWESVSALEAWNTLSSTLEWIDATIVS